MVLPPHLYFNRHTCYLGKIHHCDALKFAINVIKYGVIPKYLYNFAKSCGLISPATNLKLWVHTSIEEIVSSATSLIKSMSIRHH